MMHTGKDDKNVKNWLTVITLLIYDVLVVYFSYLLALYIRFSVNHQIHASALNYFPAFYKFAPFYTVCCIVVFALFKLYAGDWRYAGINDANRILLANAVTCLIQVFGTLLFVKRMPRSYYGLGFVIQLTLVLMGRFLYRYFTGEFTRLAKNAGEIQLNVMVIGSGETARIAVNQMESDQASIARPKCILDYRNTIAGSLFNGLPVVRNLENLQKSIEKYNIRMVILADPLMPQKTIQSIRSTLQDTNVDIQVFSGLIQSSAKEISVYDLLELSGGPITIVFGELTKRFHDPEEAVSALNGKYAVKSIGVVDDGLEIEIEQAVTSLTNVNESWIEDYEKRTGETVSFF